jgi:hypothetical protein
MVMMTIVSLIFVVSGALLHSGEDQFCVPAGLLGEVPEEVMLPNEEDPHDSTKLVRLEAAKSSVETLF